MNTGFLGPAVATVPTVYGIETYRMCPCIIYISVATVPTVYGIETNSCTGTFVGIPKRVATVPTVYGIET